MNTIVYVHISFLKDEKDGDESDSKCSGISVSTRNFCQNKNEKQTCEICDSVALICVRMAALIQLISFFFYTISSSVHKYMYSLMHSGQHHQFRQLWQRHQQIGVFFFFFI